MSSDAFSETAERWLDLWLTTLSLDWTIDAVKDGLLEGVSKVRSVDEIAAEDLIEALWEVASLADWY